MTPSVKTKAICQDWMGESSRYSIKEIEEIYRIVCVVYYYCVKDTYAQKYKYRYICRIPLEEHKKGVGKRSD